MIIFEPVQIAVWPSRATGAMSVIWSQEFPTGSYRLPVLNRVALSKPPQTIITEPVQTAVWPKRPVGTPVVVAVAAQESPTGSYWPPVLEGAPAKPPQTIIF